MSVTRAGLEPCCGLYRGPEPDGQATWIGIADLRKVTGHAQTAPLGLASAAIGWRATFLCVAGVVALLGVLIVGVVGNAPSKPRASGETLGQSLAGIGETLRTPSVPRLFLMHMASYSSFVLVVGLATTSPNAATFC